MGTGMAFPWQQLRSAQLRTGDIVEDLRLGLELTLAGVPPLFCPEALVTSLFPASKEGIRSQRVRWEHGHIGVIVDGVPKLLAQAFLRRDIRVLAIALDVSVPPLALLTTLVTVVWFLSVILLSVTRAPLAFVIATVNAASLIMSVILAWLRYGRHIVSFPSLTGAAVYALRKLPLYFKFIVARQSSWIRSKRDHET
jgi:cellulose synthase/poly-beta-1,6-N-acetylglucosamine synthase-like glycosyltransferase